MICPSHPASACFTTTWTLEMFGPGPPAESLQSFTVCLTVLEAAAQRTAVESSSSAFDQGERPGSGTSGEDGGQEKQPNLENSYFIDVKKI